MIKNLITKYADIIETRVGEGIDLGARFVDAELRLAVFGMEVVRDCAKAYVEHKDAAVAWVLERPSVEAVKRTIERGDAVCDEMEKALAAASEPERTKEEQRLDEEWNELGQQNWGDGQLTVEYVKGIDKDLLYVLLRCSDATTGQTLTSRVPYFRDFSLRVMLEDGGYTSR